MPTFTHLYIDTQAHHNLYLFIYFLNVFVACPQPPCYIVQIKRQSNKKRERNPQSLYIYTIKNSMFHSTTNECIFTFSAVDEQETTVLSKTLRAIASLNKHSSLVLLGRDSVLIGRLQPRVEVNSMIIEFPFTSY